MKFAEIVVLHDHRSTDQLYTYRIPSTWKKPVRAGMRVLIPFGRGNKPILGYVVHLTDETPDFPTKEILQVIDPWPIVSEELMDLAFYLHESTHCNLYRAFKAVGPPGDGKKIITKYRIETKEPVSYEEILKQQGEKADRYLQKGIENGIIQPVYEIENETNPKLQTVVSASVGELPALKNAARQEAVLRYLLENGPTPQPELLRNTGATSQTVKTLVQKGWARTEQTEIPREVLKDNDQPVSAPLSLNEQQQIAFQTIGKNPGGHFLLHGVTGSGKTEVYLQLVQQTLRENRSAIILVPEISLTPQTIERFTSRFGTKIAILHSKLSAAERFEQWKQIQNGEVSIVIGARSAVFAPCKQPGLIVIDEEQEDSYRSETHPRYDTVDIASWRAERNRATLVLGSATPLLTSYTKAKEGLFERLSLTSRVRSLPLPAIEIVDMRNELRSGNPSMFSRGLRTRMEEALDKGEQILLFLNKRGHSSFVFCRKCGYVKRCEDCDVSMTYHKKNDVLICHYCGKTAKLPMVCPECGSNAIGHFGAGTEQVEAYTKQIFPDARVVRMDADTTGSKSAYDDFYEKMRNKETDILIGTQMIAKGLDFPGVSVVGIVMADISLNMPDFRANEKTFQLIAQVAGRAGRGDAPGTVILQTYNPTHFAIQTAAEHDYGTFYEKEMIIRSHFLYPPFVEMVTVQSSSADSSAALHALQETRNAVHRFKQAKDLSYITIIGPTPCPIPRIRNKYRFQLVLKFVGHKKEMHMIVDWLQKLQYAKWASKDVNIQFYIE